MDWEDTERRWLSLMTDPDREPNRDPFHEMLLGTAHLSGSRRGAGELPVARIELSGEAARVILKSPTLVEQVGPDPARFDWSSGAKLMGIPVVIDDRLPPHLVVYRDSHGECIRIVWLESPRPV